MHQTLAAPVPLAVPVQHIVHGHPVAPRDPLADRPWEDRSDAELLAAVIGQNTPWREARARAATLLEVVGGLRGLQLVAPAHLEQAGLKEPALGFVRASLALGLRAAGAPAPSTALNLATLVAMMRPLLVHLQHEEVHAVLLDGRGCFRGRHRIAHGGMASCSIYPRDVLAPIVEARCSTFVLVHNHPSGHCAPSPEDVSFTRHVIAGAETLGLRLLDHLIVADDGHASAMPDGARWPPSGRVMARTH